MTSTNGRKRKLYVVADDNNYWQPVAFYTLKEAEQERRACRGLLPKTQIYRTVLPKRKKAVR